jgi:hypothetical protein
MGANGVMTELVFRASERPEPALEIRVNFGVFAGRNATQAEIDDLAHLLSGVVESFAIVAEERHEFGDRLETSVHQVVIGADEIDDRVIEIADRWAEACYASRHVDV